MNEMKVLIDQQRKLLKDYEVYFDNLEHDSSYLEICELKTYNESAKKELALLSKKLKDLDTNNQQLKFNLYNHIITERTTLISHSQHKIDAYFDRKKDSAYNLLTDIELTAQRSINRFEKEAKLLNETYRDNILKQISELDASIQLSIQEARQNLNHLEQTVKDEVNDLYQEPKSRPVSPEELKRLNKLNDVEMKVGLNWLNKIGMVIIIFAVITIMQYSYVHWFNDYIKSIMGFSIGLFFIICGELLVRKSKVIISRAFTGGGIGILYLSLFMSYFILEILSLPLALILSVLISLFSMFLSWHYQSKTICTISLIGGYVPFYTYFAKFGVEDIAYIGMIYLLLINLVTWILAYHFRFIRLNFFSFILQFPASIMLVLATNTVEIQVLYALVMMAAYFITTLIYPVRKNLQLRLLDYIFIGLNTTYYSTLVFYIIEISKFEDLKGLAAVIFAVVFLIFAISLKKYILQDKTVIGIFYITSCTFMILAVPFQFGFAWVILGWTVEAIGLLAYGLFKDKKPVALAGGAIFSLCCLDFYPLILSLAFGKVEDFRIKFTIISIAMLLILILLIVRFWKEEKLLNLLWVKLIKSATILNTWLYLLYLISSLYDDYWQGFFQKENIFLAYMLILITASVGFIIRILPRFMDSGIRVISVCLYILADMVIFLTNFNDDSILYLDHFGLYCLMLSIVILFNVWVVLNIYYLFMRLVKNNHVSIEWLPILIGIFMLVSIPALLVNKLVLNKENLVISISLIVIAFSFIAFGFIKQMIWIRRFGLICMIFSTGKLFVWDLSSFNTLGKIIAYLCYGTLLIIVSFIYNKLSAKYDETV